MKSLLYIGLSLSLLLVACQDRVTDEIDDAKHNNYIHVGAATDAPAVTLLETRAVEKTDTVRAETVPWMQGALRKGLDITYSNIDAMSGKHNVGNERVAILKWLGTTNQASGRGDYTFMYKGTTDNAEWYDNGPHYFEGQYVPEELRDDERRPANLVTDQHDDADHTYDATTGDASGVIGNYTLLSHYVGMPPNWTTSATVDQVLLPFKHRLARVIAFILIDEKLLNLKGTATAKLKNYVLDANGKDDPSTTELRFANVKVLEKVTETKPSDPTKEASKLTPEWTEARRVIPHFVGEYTSCVNLKGQSVLPETATQQEKDAANGAFIVYVNKRDDKKYHPREDGWYKAHQDYVAKGPENSAYIKKTYSRVPVYDVIVQPTYTSKEEVMYDEKGYYNEDKSVNDATVSNLVKQNNSIEFEMTLDNDLVYTKLFQFDLNANQQTVVYITIDRESVDYDESYSEKWVPEDADDGYYGVNNDLGHNMSRAGSSWQRAVTYCESEPQHNVTDGNYYDDNRVDEGDLGQYFSDSTQWIEEFAKATIDGDRHGDYFVLTKDIAIDATKLPENFVFTGHLDGRGHTIKIVKLNTSWTDAGGNEHTSGSSLFAGLNAVYTTDQEKASNPFEKDSNGMPIVQWQANVHKDNGLWVPVAGYRAELYNVNLEGGQFFPTGATFSGDNLFDSEGNAITTYNVSGYIYNCWEGTKSITNEVPIPRY